MRLLIATDAWHPQVNGVVRTLTMTAQAAKADGADITFLTPQSFRTIAMPSYPDLRLALPSAKKISALIEDARPDFIHIATEGPIGLGVRSHCYRLGLPFTTSFHTRFPEYISARLPIPESWIWAALRWFHSSSRAIMAATPALANELRGRGFRNVVLWPRGVDTQLFHPRAFDLGLPRPVFLSVGRLAVEKNLDAFLALDLPGTKVIVGDGPAHVGLQQKYPDAIFLGNQTGERLAEVYAAANVFVFPSKTDTFGLVILEALASGVPIAAFPVDGPRDVVGGSSVASLNEDLRSACVCALALDRKACRDFALRFTWQMSAAAFIRNISDVGAMEREGQSLRRMRTGAIGDGTACAVEFSGEREVSASDQADRTIILSPQYACPQPATAPRTASARDEQRRRAREHEDFQETRAHSGSHFEGRAQLNP